ncbi:unnamed protein product [Parnassius apollo]|uniref:(apollo) hypothetical protein n=1 Tax=Parnassius apollo TaxID=110799 RepID=A0A8S3X3E1_PARAO|nr:unnamed protein product [Parnassius apollo]
MISVNHNLQEISCIDDQQPGPSHQGHASVRLLCGCSILQRQSDRILRDNPMDLHQLMFTVIENRVAPRQVTETDKGQSRANKNKEIHRQKAKPRTQNTGSTNGARAVCQTSKRHYDTVIIDRSGLCFGGFFPAHVVIHGFIKQRVIGAQTREPSLAPLVIQRTTRCLKDYARRGSAKFARSVTCRFFRHGSKVRAPSSARIVLIRAV